MHSAIIPAPTGYLATLHNGYVARRNFFNFLGINCRILSIAGQPLLFVHLKAFRLKEAITVYADEAHTQPLLSIQARHIIDFSAAYDVVDHTTSERVGTLKRKGFASLVRDEWEICDAIEQPIGLLQEDSLLMALLRRLFSNLIPQNYHLYLHGQVVATFEGTWNPFIVKHTAHLGFEPGAGLDVRLVLALSVLLLTIEGKQG